MREPVASSAYAIGPGTAAALAETLKVLAEPLRLRMLSAIASDPRGEVTVQDLAGLTELSQPTVSHHLKKLRETGLLQSERRGTWVFYRLTPQRRGEVIALLEGVSQSTSAIETEASAHRTAELRAANDEVERLALRLRDEYSQYSAEFVITMVRESYADLVRSQRPSPQLVAITEQFARQRLSDFSRDHDSTAPQVLFVCVANAGRSQLAAALLEQLGEGAVIARSAGSSPAAEVHANVRPLLVEIAGEDAARAAYPKPLTYDAVRAADVVVTMGCGDVCPVIPGVRYEDWQLGDPALASDAGVREIRNDIERRVRGLIDELTHGERRA